MVGDRSRRGVLEHADQATVGRDLEAGLDRGHDLAGGLIVRIVEAGEPMVDVVGPGIGPDEAGIVGRLVHELEPFAGLPAVVPACEGHDLAELRRPGQDDLELPVRLLELQGRPIIVDDRGHGELLGVEDAGLETVPEGRQRDRRRPLEGLPAEVELELDQIVERVVAPAALGLERLLGVIDRLAGQGRDEGENDDGDDRELSSHVRSLLRKGAFFEGFGGSRPFSSGLRSRRPIGARRGTGFRCRSR